VNTLNHYFEVEFKSVRPFLHTVGIGKLFFKSTYLPEALAEHA